MAHKWGKKNVNIHGFQKALNTLFVYDCAHQLKYLDFQHLQISFVPIPLTRWHIQHPNNLFNI